MALKQSGRSSRKRAFTLVEILIVVLIAGILVGMMLLSATNAADSAKAARIIADIKTMRSVAVLYKADHGDWPLWIYVPATGKYSALGATSCLPSKYSDLNTMGDGYWIGAMKSPIDGAAYSIADVTDLDIGVKKILERKSSENSLFGQNGMPMDKTAEDIAASPYKTEHSKLITIISK